MSLATDLAADVTDELFWDPKVDNAAIAASADGGRITLRGTVGSLREKRDARKAAERVFGVAAQDASATTTAPGTRAEAASASASAASRSGCRAPISSLSERSARSRARSVNRAPSGRT